MTDLCTRPGLNDNNTESGFTVPELIVVMTLTLFFSTMVFSFMLDMWGQSGRLQNSSDVMVTRQNLGDSLRNRLNAASSLLNQNSIQDDHVFEEDPEDMSGKYWKPLHAISGYQTVTPSPGNYAAVMYYQAPAVDSAKNLIMDGAAPYEDEFVLYLDGTTKSLMLRTLANTEDGISNLLKTSCPDNAATLACPADRILAEDVSLVTLKYFSKSGNVIDWTSMTDPDTGDYCGSDFGDVEVVEIAVTMEKRAVIKGTAASKSTTTIRVALRNI